MTAMDLVKCHKCGKIIDRIMFTKGYVKKYGNLCYGCNPECGAVLEKYNIEVKNAKNCEELDLIEKKYWGIKRKKFLFPFNEED